MQKARTLLRLVVARLFATLCILSSAYSYAAPMSTGWLQEPNHPPIETRFVLTGQSDPSNKTVSGYLEVQLTGDWKTYWRSPGEGGIAPSMDWSRSSNITDIDWHWPYPQRFDLLGIETLGYKHSAIFPMTLHLEDLTQPVVLNATLTLSSCTTICVLTDYPIQLSFNPAELSVSEPAMHTYAQAMALVPKPSPLLTDIDAIWDANNNQLQVSATNQQGWKTPEVLIDGDSEEVQDSNFSRPNITIDGEKLIATFEVSSWMGTPELENESIRLTFHDKAFLAEQQTQVVNGQITNNQQSLPSMLLIALLGGLILNVMPCVFPVLGMKLSAIVSSVGIEKQQVRLQFICSAFGILVSFLLIALLLAILKLTGNAIGWGIQFQSGWFIGFMLLVTALFGANMLGLFEIRLSSNANTWLATKGNNGYLGHFTQGMFATLLATPCSAPFLGTAVAFALATSISTMFAIFTALAVGMALPWLTIALFPSIATKLPRPGRWMNQVKYLFGLMMLGTSVWLASLLSNHIPTTWTSLLLASSAVLLFVRIKQIHGNKVAAVSTILLAMVISLAAIVSMTLSAKPLPPEPNWQPLSTQDIKQHVSQGSVVFVDVTAAWCVTCKANKIGVLLQEPVYSQLTNGQVIPMQGDWTVPNEKVTQYLQSHGRFGVPFNIVYGPAAPNGIELPVILSSEAVIEAIERAKGGRNEQKK